MNASSPRYGYAGAASEDEFWESVEPHVAKMSRVAARLAGFRDRDDVVQDALLDAWNSRTSYDPARGSLSAWLLAITAHRATRVARRKRAWLAVQEASESGPGDRNLDLAVALAKLNPRQRLAIDCYYYVGLTVDETASVLKCSSGTVKWTLYDARQRLRALMAEVSGGRRR